MLTLHGMDLIKRSVQCVKMYVNKARQVSRDISHVSRVLPLLLGVLLQ